MRTAIGFLLLVLLLSGFISFLVRDLPRLFKRPRCTGLTARWCPIHGDCTCPPWPDRASTPSDGCPLHDRSSPHPGRRHE